MADRLQWQLRLIEEVRTCKLAYEPLPQFRSSERAMTALENVLARYPNDRDAILDAARNIS